RPRLSTVYVSGMNETYGPIITNGQLSAWKALLAVEMCSQMAHRGHGFLTSLSVLVEGPAATAKLFRCGILYFGDLAAQCPDGSIRILDREKDFIMSGGE
ncbi:uncharacterized protein K489DRAFT_296875, partial [Dissoconium aciculare CBS 342.82]|uniref:Uncharacterized protein n=1 Tax=Dissoconium aciculare CBS 342.82 TaxID=1314786 RepID=A0A6J3LW95_9PEZI